MRIYILIKLNNEKEIENYYTIDAIDFDSQDLIKEAIIKLDIFKNFILDNFQNEYKIYIKNTENNKHLTLNLKYYRYYKETIFDDEDDFIFYGEKIFIKKELLDNVYANNFYNLILNYGFKPKYNINNKIMNYGFELEISCGSDDNLKILIEDLIKNNLLNNNKIILKNDSSINGENTVEIVSCPTTMKDLFAIVEELTKIFSKFDNTAKGHNKGGMHVHCSYNKLNNTKILKLINFIYNAENENFICQIAQRRSNSYFNFDLNNICSGSNLLNFFLKKDFKIINKNRYSALNFTNNTIEFRIFNSNLRKERILKNLNFVESILSFIASKHYSNSYVDFENYLMKNKKYKYLKDFVKYLNEQ